MELPILQERFEPFREYAGEQQRRIEDGEDPLALPDYRDTFFSEGGAQITCLTVPPEVAGDTDEKFLAQVFSFEADSTSEEREEMEPLSDQVEGWVQPMIKAVGHVGLEQIVAYSSQDVFAVVAKDPGERLSTLSGDSFLYVPDSSYIQLFEAFRTLERLGLTVAEEYFECIMFRDPEPDNLYTFNPDFTVAKLAENNGTTFIDHVAGLGHEMAITTATSYQGAPVPPEAIHYYKVVARILGREASLEVIDKWLRSRLPIPPIDYRASEP